MPSYQNVTPPLSLSSGDVGFSFNNEAFPGSATSGSQFAVPSFTGVPDGGTAVRWQTIFGSNPTAVNIVLRTLAQAIAERSGREPISDVFLSPDAFAHRTSEASIAEQLGEVLVANGLPRPSPADDDRIGGWQLMYQLLESDAWDRVP